MERKKSFDPWILVTLAVLGLYLLFLIYPMVSVARMSVVDKDGFTFKYFIDFFSHGYYVETLKNSFTVSLATTVVSLLLGIPLAYLYSVYEIKGRRFLQIVIILCTMSAPFIGAYSWILLLGRSGVITVFLEKKLGITIGTIYGFKGILLSMSSRLFPLAFMYVAGAMKNIDNTLLEASENLGCSGIKKFWKIGVSLCMPSVLAAALMIFMRAFADFGTPLMIGEGYRTFPVEIYNQFVGEAGTNYNFAAAISMIAIAITAIVFLFQKYVNKHYQFTMNALYPIERKKAKPVANIFIHLFAYGVVFISMMPQLYLIYTSFRKSSKSGFAFVDGYSFGNYAAAFKRMGKGFKNEIWNTISIGVCTMAIIILLAILIAYLVVRRKNVLNDTIDTFSMLPYIIPGSVVGIALATTFSTGILVLTGTAAIMIIAMCIRRIPYTIRSSVATLQQIPMSIEEAAISLGASKPKTFFSITVPMMASGIVSGAILSWVSIITELSSSIMLYSARNTTLTVMIYSLVNRGTYGQAAAVATILTVLTVFSLVLFNIFSKDNDLSL